MRVLRDTVSAMVRPLIAPVIMAAALLLSAGAAGAHTAAPDSQIDAAPVASVAVTTVVAWPNGEILSAGAPPVPTLPLVLAAAIAVAGCASRRRLALALALLVAIVGVDAAVHSVHHLHDSDAAACALASGSMHPAAILSDGAVACVAPEPAHDARADGATPPPEVRPSRPDRGRAPPSSAA
jgi:hypothetical protein